MKFSVKNIFLGVGVVLVLTLGGISIAYKSGVFSSKEVQSSENSNETLSPALKSEPTKHSIIQKTLPPFRSAIDLEPIFLQLASDPKSVKVDMKIMQDGKDELLGQDSPEAKDFIMRAFERITSDQKALLGIELFCSVLSSKAKPSDNFGATFWKSMASLADIFKCHLELKIKEPLQLGKLNMDTPSSQTLYLGSQSVRKIKPEIEMHHFFEAIASYANQTLAFLSNRVKFYVNHHEYFRMTDSLNELVKISCSYFISMNEKRYPNFIKKYNAFILQFTTEMKGKVCSNYFLRPSDVLPFHSIDPSISSYFASDLSTSIKDRIFDALMYESVVTKLTQGVLNLNNDETKYDPIVIEEYKKNIFASAHYDSQLFAINKFSLTEEEPMCSSDGKWMHKESIDTEYLDYYTPKATFSACLQMMDDFCAQNRGKSAKPKMDEIEAVFDVSMAKTNSLFDKAVLSYAAKVLKTE